MGADPWQPRSGSVTVLAPARRSRHVLRRVPAVTRRTRYCDPAAVSAIRSTPVARRVDDCPSSLVQGLEHLLNFFTAMPGPLPHREPFRTPMPSRDWQRPLARYCTSPVQVVRRLYGGDPRPIRRVTGGRRAKATARAAPSALRGNGRDSTSSAANATVEWPESVCTRYPTAVKCVLWRHEQVATMRRSSS